MSFLQEEIIRNSEEPRKYTIHRPEELKTTEELSWTEFLSLVVSFLNNKSNKKAIIYSWNTAPQLHRLYKNINGQIESELIDYKQAYRCKVKENEIIKLSIRMWYSCRIRGLLWKVFWNYRIVRIIMTYLGFNEESETFSLYQIEEVLTNITFS